MRGHDASKPVTAHVRIFLGSPEDLTLADSTVAEIVRWNREPRTDKLESVDALVTSEQVGVLQAAGLRVEVIAPVWSPAELKKQVSQEDRYKKLLDQLRPSSDRE